MNIKDSRLGKVIKAHLYSVLFFTTCFLLFLAEWLLFTEDIGGIGNKYIVTIAKGIGDIAAPVYHLLVSSSKKGNGSFWL